MPCVDDKLIAALETLGYAAYLQGTVGDYDDSFFTFTLFDATFTAYYDNDAAVTSYEYGVNFYSDDPEKVGSIFYDLKPALVAAGFNLTGKGIDLASDEPTHTGKTWTITYFEREEPNG